MHTFAHDSGRNKQTNKTKKKKNTKKQQTKKKNGKQTNKQNEKKKRKKLPHWGLVPASVCIAPGFSVGTCKPFGLTVRRWAGKQKDLGSNLLRLSFLFKGCGLWTLSCDFVPHNIKTTLIAAHLNAEVILVVTV